ncbi:MAG: TIGR03084 family metal-binding protein [Ottowia sp.]|uniref:TIGR03084 family metal-binding protein n=1 Tax=Ottowia sp. TaxID=1898956 RepID=UPI003C7758BE
MIEEAQDFLQESNALHDLLAPVAEARYAEPTQFKNWTIDNVLQHLHFFNLAAICSLKEPARFTEMYDSLKRKRGEGLSTVDATDELLEGVRGRALLRLWREGFLQTAAEFSQADPRQRVRWAGPDMSARSSISARLMETWSHGQEIYDLLGVVRQNTDHIRSIAVIGINTYEWTFRNRGEEAPEPKPHVVLKSPSGAIWTWNEPSQEHRIEGLAEEFCQVVTQVRGISDTQLSVKGDPAMKWMAIAQCFAGPVESPPQPGTRGPKVRQ